MTASLQKLFSSFSNVFNIPLEIGGSRITLGNIINLILALIIVIFICRVLKDFLRNRLLPKLGIDEGNREAISTIISYSLGTLGFIAVLQSTGFNIASIAVIIGGLGVGIGFGLQDLTKNFVSGLTLLLEQKIKVGDFVEFDGLSGYVKMISLRSMVIRTREGGDIVVPNSNIIENRVLNWTYDGFLVGRIHLPIGVAYNSDPVLVTESLLQAAYMEPTVLQDPAPRVNFIGFGDNALNFELRVWIEPIDKAPDISSSINFLIEYCLRQQGIQIPFPQRDLWLRNPEVLFAGRQRRNVEQKYPQLTKDSNAIKSQKTLFVRDLLKQVIYFQNFTDIELRQLIEVGYRQRLHESEILFHEGNPGDAFYIVLSGAVEVFVEKIDKHLATLPAGNFFGELSLMLGIPRTASVRALEETILFVINDKGFKRILQEQPELSEVIIHELGKHQKELGERQKQLRAMGLVDRSEDDKNPVVWVRNRLKKLFSV
ncbi:mechanosensitive ion channel domain-containing protein [Lusitaniella coriacea]|uniref:mechanosensitive ion channel domain-containing protein n=1 Tax=Lusitaniella coriacea TaxID=1983105 RepID=UPI003CF6D956